MFIDLQIPSAFEFQGEAAVFCDLFEHMIEETQSAADVARTLARQVNFDADVGFCGLTAHVRSAPAA